LNDSKSECKENKKNNKKKTNKSKKSHSSFIEENSDSKEEENREAKNCRKILDYYTSASDISEEELKIEDLNLRKKEKRVKELTKENSKRKALIINDVLLKNFSMK